MWGWPIRDLKLTWVWSLRYLEFGRNKSEKKWTWNLENCGGLYSQKPWGDIEVTVSWPWPICDLNVSWVWSIRYLQFGRNKHNHPLSAFRHFIFSIFSGILHIWGTSLRSISTHHTMVTRVPLHMASLSKFIFLYILCYYCAYPYVMEWKYSRLYDCFSACVSTVCGMKERTILRSGVWWICDWLFFSSSDVLSRPSLEKYVQE